MKAANKFVALSLVTLVAACNSADNMRGEGNAAQTREAATESATRQEQITTVADAGNQSRPAVVAGRAETELFLDLDEVESAKLQIDLGTAAQAQPAGFSLVDEAQVTSTTQPKFSEEYGASKMLDASQYFMIGCAKQADRQARTIFLELIKSGDSKVTEKVVFRVVRCVSLKISLFNLENNSKYFLKSTLYTNKLIDGDLVEHYLTHTGESGVFEVKDGKIVDQGAIRLAYRRIATPPAQESQGSGVTTQENVKRGDAVFTVLDSVSKAPIADAAVRISALGKVWGPARKTGADGKLTIQGLGEGSYFYEVRHASYVREIGDKIHVSGFRQAAETVHLSKTQFGYTCHAERAVPSLGVTVHFKAKTNAHDDAEAKTEVVAACKKLVPELASDITFTCTKLTTNKLVSGTDCVKQYK